MPNAENTSPSPTKKASTEEYDIVIIGSGTAGKLIAWTFASDGQRVAMIERKYIGGSCPNIACLPSKNIIHTAQVASYVRRSEEFGITRSDFKLNMSTIRERKRKMVSSLIDTHLAAYKDSGAELIMGSGRFIGPRIVEVTLNDGTKRQLKGTT
jgi:pyruvate/2-oxoglutarate dehydrogenase complex dihydrolipoamide dehydrogenase (E3) component